MGILFSVLIYFSHDELHAFGKYLYAGDAHNGVIKQHGHGSKHDKQ